MYIVKLLMGRGTSYLGSRERFHFLRRHAQSPTTETQASLRDASQFKSEGSGECNDETMPGLCSVNKPKPKPNPKPKLPEVFNRSLSYTPLPRSVVLRNVFDPRPHFVFKFSFSFRVEYGKARIE